MQDWCKTHWPPVPAGWSPADWPQNRPLPGNLVDEGKLLHFIQHQAERAPKKGKKIQRAQKRNAKRQERRSAKQARLEDLEGTVFVGGRPPSEPSLEIAGDESSDEEIRLNYHTVRGYITAIKALYEEQKSLGLNVSLNPCGDALKQTVLEIKRGTWSRKKAEYADRNEGSLKDSYTASQIPAHTDAVFKEQSQIACALRTSVDFLLGNHMAMRHSNRLALELPDLFSIDLPREGIQKGPDGAPVKALVVMMGHGKCNQHGRIEYAGALRHRDPKACLVGAIAISLFWR